MSFTKLHYSSIFTVLLGCAWYFTVLTCSSHRERPLLHINSIPDKKFQQNIPLGIVAVFFFCRQGWFWGAPLYAADIKFDYIQRIQHCMNTKINRQTLQLIYVIGLVVNEVKIIPMFQGFSAFGPQPVTCRFVNILCRSWLCQTLCKHLLLEEARNLY